MQNNTSNNKSNSPTSRPSSVSAQSDGQTSATAPPQSRRMSSDKTGAPSIKSAGAGNASSRSIEALQQQVTALTNRNAALQAENTKLRGYATALLRKFDELKEQQRLTQSTVGTGFRDGTYEISTVNPQKRCIVCAAGMKFCFEDFGYSDRERINRVLSGTYGRESFKNEYDGVKVVGGKPRLVETEDYY